ncbi:hypothetical protein KY328_06060, partial [Candidatus Woesearchaeota archaeon]|nr:hypothetical protein [Candidatus Woesearchaeota archaeon]
MKKIILTLAIICILFIAGCKCGEQRADEAALGEVTPKTTAPSGDAVVLTDTEQVNQDISVTRTFEVDVQDRVEQTVTLEFENSGDAQTIDYSITLPDSFGDNDLDLETSHPATITKGTWTVTFEKAPIERKKTTFWIKGKVLSLAQYVGKEMNIDLNEYVDTKKLAEAAKDNARNDFAFALKLGDIRKMPEGKAKDEARLKLIEENPGEFLDSDCDLLPTTASMAACKAALRRDWEVCHDYTETFEQVDDCKELLYGHLKRTMKCDSLKGADKDQCLFRVATLSRWELGCTDIAGDTKANICLSTVTGDIKYCKGMKGAELEDCCYATEQLLSVVAECMGVDEATLDEDASRRFKELK